jgi:hypothetical protein
VCTERRIAPLRSAFAFEINQLLLNHDGRGG